jgi:hypothetical protein
MTDILIKIIRAILEKSPLCFCWPTWRAPNFGAWMSVFTGCWLMMNKLWNTKYGWNLTNCFGAISVQIPVYMHIDEWHPKEHFFIHKKAKTCKSIKIFRSIFIITILSHLHNVHERVQIIHKYCSIFAQGTNSEAINEPLLCTSQV